MQSFSLIHAMVLLDKGEDFSENGESGQFVKNAKNIALAKELAYRVLGRNLGEIPRKTQVLFLLIEKMKERICLTKKIEFSAYRFTIKEIRTETGWSGKTIRGHLKILLGAGLVGMRGKKYQLLASSRKTHRAFTALPEALAITFPDSSPA